MGRALVKGTSCAVKAGVDRCPTPVRSKKTACVFSTQVIGIFTFRGTEDLLASAQDPCSSETWGLVA